MFDWDDLRFFLELTRRGSLSETARRLGADHSTVARRVANLERRLELKLFDRLPRGWVPTADGERLFERAQAVERAAFAVERSAGGARGEVAGLVRISAPPALASQWLVPRLAPLRDRHPGLVLDVIGATAAADLSRREADLALRLSRPEEGSMIARRLGEVRYGLYGARDRFATAPEADHVFLGYDEELDHTPQQLWTREHAGPRPFVFLANDLASLIAAARAGIGLAAIPDLMVEDDPALVRLDVGPTPSRDLWLVVHPDLRRSASVRVVMDHLVEITRDLRRPAATAAPPDAPPREAP